MNTINMVRLLNSVLPDQKIITDATCLLKEEIEAGAFDDLGLHEMPRAVDIMSKVFVLANYGNAFGNHYITQVAISGKEDEEDGVVTPKHFFASLYYTENMQLITADFHEELR